MISDRYYYSCLANLRARGYTQDKWIYEIADFIPKPDISFFLDVDVDIAISRVRNREEEKNRFIDVPLQYRLRREYLSICESINGYLIKSDTDAQITFDKILTVVNKL